MLNNKSKINICPSCQYPNPEHLTNCFKCGINIFEAYQLMKQQEQMRREEAQRLQQEELRRQEIINQNNSLVNNNIFKGVNGTIILEEHKIIIKREGLWNNFRFGLKGDKEIYINQISAIQFKLNGLITYGYIQFSFKGGTENQSAYLETGRDENTVRFESHQEERFRYLKDMLDQKINNYNRPMETIINNSSISPTEEIEKLASLMERGLITQEEFQTRKRQILGL